MSHSTFMNLMYEGGPVMWPLLFASIVGMVAAVERAWVLRRARADAGALLKRLRSSLIQASTPAALDWLRKESTPLARVAQAGLESFDRPAALVEKAVERQANIELRRLEKRFGLLAAVVNLAPLLGFLGTVTGMIDSFSVLAEVGLTNPGLVADGISEALITTAAGLVVAIPAQLALNVYTHRVRDITADFERVGGYLVELRETQLG